MKAKFSLSKRQKIIIAVGTVLLISLSGFGYYVSTSRADTSATETPVQTASVRRSDLTIDATGTGTLAPSKEEDLSFSTSGNVKAVYVQAGDSVQSGELLAEIDNSEAQTEFDQANLAYLQLTSETAIASAQDDVVTAKKELESAEHYLELLISPDVMHWEIRVAQYEKEVEDAKATANANSSDASLQKDLNDAEAQLGFANEMLRLARVKYTDEYAFEHFVISKNGRHFLAMPSDLDIKQARLAVDDAEAALYEANMVFQIVAGGIPMPDKTDNEKLLAIQAAKRTLDEARETLDGTRITAPFAGTVLAVNVTAGADAGTDTAITVADLSQPYLDVYLDQSDWDKIAPEYNVEVTFDSLPDQIFTAKVTSVDKELYQSGGSSVVHGTVLLNSSFDGANLPMGATASVDVIAAEAKDALIVPVEALHETSDGNYAVFVVTSDGLRLRTVEVGLQSELYAEIKSGLEEGDTVTTGIVKVQ